MVASISKRLRPVLYQGDPLAAPPSSELGAILDRHRGQPDALITVLEAIEARYGYLPEQELRYAARELRFPLSRVYGVATFYNLFHLAPPGRHLVRVCRGTACYVNRSDAILTRLKAGLGVGEDETTPDGLFTLQTVACVGASSLAPVVVVDDEIHGRMTPEAAWELLERVRTEAAGERDSETARRRESEMARGLSSPCPAIPPSRRPAVPPSRRLPGDEAAR